MKSHIASIVLMAAALPAAADEMKTVRLALGTSTLNIAYPNVTLPEALGYWKEEGLDVELLTTGGTLQAVQQVIGGGADIVEGNVGALLQGIALNDLPLKVLVAHGVTDWKFVVPEGSEITDGKALEGKKIGMISLSTGGIPLLKSFLSTSGVSADSVEVIPVGFGAAPLEALKNGDVDALLYWGSAVAAYENTDTPLETFAPAAWTGQPDYVIGTTGTFETENPDAVIGVSRGMMKAILFARTNPECALELFWRDFPDTVSQGPDEATSKAWDLNILNSKIAGYSAAAKLGEIEGKVSDETWAGLQDYLVFADMIPEPIAKDVFLTSIPGFYEKVMDFDQAAIIEQAKACDF